jgi:hypothetical protein
MELITKSQLSAKRSWYDRTHAYNALNEAVNLKSRRLSIASDVTIFLSHKHEEKKELEDAIALLKSINVNVYVDWTDEGMPKITSGATAKRLKDKIKTCKKFVFLATEKAINSKWCNWELGVGDAHKYIQHIALLVVKDDYTTCSGTEYLDIYPTIGKRHANNDDYDVRFPDGTTVDLIRWLNS